jgi:hypothetical protein
MLIPDRIHPTLALHWVMATAILKAWNAPAVVTSAVLDAGSIDRTRTQEAQIQGSNWDGVVLSWDESDNRLPLPLNGQIADIAYLLKISDIESDLNRELLSVTGLPEGNYTLSVDSTFVADFSSQQLNQGINLAEFKTPMRDQSQAVVWLIRDYEYTQLVHTRLLVRDMDNQIPSASGDNEMKEFELLEQELIHKAAQPRTHEFRLARRGVSEGH